MSLAPRSLYRSFLRELPPISHARTPMHNSLRATFAGPVDAAPAPNIANEFLTYLRSQRLYVTLLERYNPGLQGESDVQDVVKRTARRVGLEIGSMGSSTPIPKRKI